LTIIPLHNIVFGSMISNLARGVRPAEVPAGGSVGDER